MGLMNIEGEKMKLLWEWLPATIITSQWPK